MYAIHYTPTAEKYITKLDKHLQERILSALERARLQPEHYFVKLSGWNEYRMRVGDFRIIADIQKNVLVILVVRVGKRENVYD